MRLTLFALPLLTALIVPTPTAQQTLPAHITVTTRGNCPVSMIAQRRDSGQTMWVVSLEDAAKPKHDEAPKPGSTGLHITLTAPENSPIHQAELAVYFVPLATRALPVNQYSQYPSKAPKPPAEQKKTFHISATDDASPNLTTDLLVGPASGITRVHILSMDYANGATWTAPNNSACTVEPNGLLLVGTKP